MTPPQKNDYENYLIVLPPLSTTIPFLWLIFRISMEVCNKVYALGKTYAKLFDLVRRSFGNSVEICLTSPQHFGQFSNIFFKYLFFFQIWISFPWNLLLLPTIQITSLRYTKYFSDETGLKKIFKYIPPHFIYYSPFCHIMTLFPVDESIMTHLLGTED